MRDTPLLMAMPKSFYSKDLYREIGRGWQGLGFTYLFLLILLLFVPLTIKAINYVSGITLEKPFNLEYIIRQIPDINIGNGELSTEAPMPYYIRSDDGKTIAIIDTTRPVTDWSERMDEYEVFAVAGKEQILLRKSSGEKRLYDIHTDDMVITSDSTRVFLLNILDNAWKFILVLSIIFVLLTYLMGIISSLIYGLIGKIADILLKTDLVYSDLVRLSSIAQTPAAIVFFILIIIGIEIPLWLYFVIDLGYLFYAIKVNSDDSI